MQECDWSERANEEELDDDSSSDNDEETASDIDVPV